MLLLKKKWPDYVCITVGYEVRRADSCRAIVGNFREGLFFAILAKITICGMGTSHTWPCKNSKIPKNSET